MIVFKHIEKTAGTSFKTLLRGNYGVFHVDSNKTKKNIYSQNDLNFAKKIFIGIKAISGHNLPSPGEIGDDKDIYVTFLRQPVERCASHYQDGVLRGGSEVPFEEWINDKKNQNFMVQSIAGSEDLRKAKLLLGKSYYFVGITERFDESITLLNIILPEKLIPKYKTSVKAKSNSIKNKLINDKHTYSLLKEFNELDQQLYDFALQKLYLPMIEKYRDQLASNKLDSTEFGQRQKIKHKSSVLYNKFIYRPMCKFTNYNYFIPSGTLIKR